MERRYPWHRLGILVLVAVMVLVLAASGCTRQPENKPDTSGGKETVTLYFADDQAQYLVPEEREVTLNGKELAQVVVEELIAGSRTGLGQTIPEGTKLLSVQVAAGVATVDFSPEFQENHWGGSAGETMTVYSVVNSLASLEGIEKVQFMLAGEVREEILGHMYYAEPFTPDWNLVK